tara:strand:- start:140 stop:391 length:252 start_codon:yes stop_codon:yes gene_type:complete
LGKTVRTPVGATGEDEPEFALIKQSGVAKTLAFRIFWASSHVVTCPMIVLGNGRTLDWWSLNNNCLMDYYSTDHLHQLRNGLK